MSSLTNIIEQARKRIIYALISTFIKFLSVPVSDRRSNRWLQIEVRLTCWKAIELNGLELFLTWEGQEGNNCREEVEGVCMIANYPSHRRYYILWWWEERLYSSVKPQCKIVTVEMPIFIIDHHYQQLLVWPGLGWSDQQQQQQQTYSEEFKINKVFHPRSHWDQSANYCL